MRMIGEIMKLATRDVQPEQSYKKRRRLSLFLVLLVLCALLLTVILLAVSFGSVAISFGTILQIVLNGTGLFHFARQWDVSAEVIIWQVRLPVVIGAALVGAALAVAGALFHGRGIDNRVLRVWHCKDWWKYASCHFATGWCRG